MAQEDIDIWVTQLGKSKITTLKNAIDLLNACYLNEFPCTVEIKIKK